MAPKMNHSKQESPNKDLSVTLQNLSNGPLLLPFVSILNAVLWIRGILFFYLHLNLHFFERAFLILSSFYILPERSPSSQAGWSLVRSKDLVHHSSLNKSGNH